MFRLQFTMDNSVFETCPGIEAARILRDLARRIELKSNPDGGNLFDSNGNRIGTWEFTPAETAEDE